MVPFISEVCPENQQKVNLAWVSPLPAMTSDDDDDVSIVQQTHGASPVLMEPTTATTELSANILLVDDI